MPARAPTQEPRDTAGCCMRDRLRMTRCRDRECAHLLPCTSHGGDSRSARCVESTWAYRYLGSLALGNVTFLARSTTGYSSLTRVRAFVHSRRDAPRRSRDRSGGNGGEPRSNWSTAVVKRDACKSALKATWTDPRGCKSAFSPLSALGALIVTRP